MLESLQQKLRVVNPSSNWQFHSSFSSASFIERLTETKPANFLWVWSPYFTTDLNRLITENLSEIDTIQIIPNQSGDGKIRITQKNFENSTALEKVDYKQEKLATELTEVLVHAKVWLTDNKIAIGSWNMTEAGINASKAGGNNVEAGIINSIDLLDIQELTNHLTPLNAPTYSEESELKDEKEDLILN